VAPFVGIPETRFALVTMFAPFRHLDDYAKHDKTAAVELLYACPLCGATRRWGLYQADREPLKVQFADLVVSQVNQ